MTIDWMSKAMENGEEAQAATHATNYGAKSVNVA